MDRIIRVKPSYRKDGYFWYPMRWHEDRWQHLQGNRKGCGSFEEAQEFSPAGGYVDCDMRYMLPEWVNRYPHAGCLYIGNGPSTKELLDKSAFWYDTHYDVAVCVNAAYPFFEKVARECERTVWFWLVPEVDATQQDWFYRNTCPQFIRVWNGSRPMRPLAAWEPHNRYIWIDRGWQEPFNPRMYERGLQDHPELSSGFGMGTSTLNAMHLLSILGAASIDLIGCGMQWTDGQPVHFYEKEAIPQPPTQQDAWAGGAKLIQGLLPDFERAGVRLNFLCDTLIETI